MSEFPSVVVCSKKLMKFTPDRDAIYKAYFTVPSILRIRFVGDTSEGYHCEHPVIQLSSINAVRNQLYMWYSTYIHTYAAPKYFSYSRNGISVRDELNDDYKKSVTYIREESIISRFKPEVNTTYYYVRTRTVLPGDDKETYIIIVVEAEAWMKPMKTTNVHVCFSKQEFRDHIQYLPYDRSPFVKQILKCQCIGCN